MVRALFRTMRPKQWAKNVFIFAGLFFDGKLLDPAKVLVSLIAFAIFCLVSSAIYLINDLVDIEKDRRHPVKKNAAPGLGRTGSRLWLRSLLWLSWLYVCPRHLSFTRCSV